MMQSSLNLGHELVIDLFAGGGGASTAMEQALGRPVDIAVNHDPEAVEQHRANHPDTEHFCQSVFKVHPQAVTRGKPVGLLWASPDCTHHSRAKGGKPVKKNIRGLAWVVVRWARRVKPRCIMLENVEEFADWGPLGPDDRPDPTRKGEQFREFVRQLERLGYTVESRAIRACDYGAPTIRKRLFMIARRDGRPIVWPEPTHAAPESEDVKKGRKQPFRAAAECIDWTIPAPSIFKRKKPLAENTLRRIARGVQRFVLEAADPFLIGIDNKSAGASCSWPGGEPLRTVTVENRHAIVAPYFIPRHGERDGQDPRTRSTEDPLPTITGTGNGASLVAGFLAKHYGGNYQGAGASLEEPTHTVTAKDHNAVVAAHLLNQKGSDQRSVAADAPAPTITAGGNHAGLVAALMAPYYGSGSGETGRDLNDPAPTITSKDRLQLVTVTIDGETYVLADIGMRMLQPRELYRAQGFPDDYIIDRGADGRRLNKTTQVRLVGNSVSPSPARALVEANFAHEALIPDTAMTA